MIGQHPYGSRVWAAKKLKLRRVKRRFHKRLGEGHTGILGRDVLPIDPASPSHCREPIRLLRTRILRIHWSLFISPDGQARGLIRGVVVVVLVPAFLNIHAFTQSPCYVRT